MGRGDTLDESLLQSGRSRMPSTMELSCSMRRAVFLGILAISLMATAAEEHSHPPPERLGTVTFGTSCAPGVARDFQRAVALLHSFAYDSAQKAFLDIAAVDPACAMAHWGAAMSNWHQ